MAQAYAIDQGPEERLIAALANAVRTGDFEPPQLPHIAMEILDLTRKPDVSMRQIGRLMARDQMLTAKVLHVANSAFYPGGGNISSPARAMAHIGLDGLKQMLFAYAFKGAVFRDKSHQTHMQYLWVHSLACAVGADLIGKARRKPNPMGFVGGLLHDIGKPVALNTLITLRRTDPDLADDPEFLLQLVDRVHAQLGGLVASRWNLPAELRAVIVHHHHAQGLRGEHADLVRVVAAADRICRVLALGYPERPSGAPDTIAELPELRALGLDETHCELIEGTLTAKMAAIGSA